MNDSISVQRNGLKDYFNRVRDWISVPKQEIAVEGLGGSATAYFLSRLHQLEKERPILIVTNDQNRGDLLLEDIKYFFHYLNLKKRPLVYPSWELLPYESLSPHNEISGERIQILNRLRNGENLFLIAPIEGLMQVVVPRNILQKNVLSVNLDDVLDRELLETCLAENGFSRSPLVENRGDFSVRGDIVDFFQPEKCFQIQSTVFEQPRRLKRRLLLPNNQRHIFLIWSKVFKEI